METQKRSHRDAMLRRILTATAALALVVGVSSCGKAAQKLTEKGIEGATGAKIDTDDGSFSIQTDEGEFSAKATGELPKDWPNDLLPVPDGFEITNVMETNYDGGGQTAVYLEGSGNGGELIDSYVATFEEHGLEISMQSKSGDGGLVTATDGAGNMYHVTVTADGGDALVVSLAVVDNPEQTD